MTSLKSQSRASHTLQRISKLTNSFRHIFVIVFGKILAILRKSAFLIFLSTSSFQSRLYDIDIQIPRSYESYFINYITFFCILQDNFAYFCELIL